MEASKNRATLADYRGADEVAPGLFVGGIGAAWNRDALRDWGITHVVAVHHLPQEDVEKFRDDGITYLWINAFDFEGQDLISFFDEAYDFIEAAFKAKGRVLVHCQVGASRSATVAIAYVMKKRRILYAEALKLVQAARPVVQPNTAFVVQLELWGQMGYSLEGTSKWHKLYHSQKGIWKTVAQSDAEEAERRKRQEREDAERSAALDAARKLGSGAATSSAVPSAGAAGGSKERSGDLGNGPGHGSSGSRRSNSRRSPTGALSKSASSSSLTASKEDLITDDH